MFAVSPPKLENIHITVIIIETHKSIPYLYVFIHRNILQASIVSVSTFVVSSCLIEYLESYACRKEAKITQARVLEVNLHF